jgi:hypothetical protein
MRLVIVLLAGLALSACAIGLPSTTAEQQAIQQQMQAKPAS